MKQPPVETMEIAASLAKAANAPLKPVVSTAPPDTKEPKSAPATARKAIKTKEEADTVQKTIRPKRSTSERYIRAAAERSMKIGRTVSEQEIMLEVLEKGTP